MAVQLLLYVSVIVWRQGAATSLGFPGDVRVRVNVNMCQNKLTYIVCVFQPCAVVVK